MLKNFCKIMVLIAFISGCFLFMAKNCYAQEMPNSMSAKDFAAKYGSSEMQQLFSDESPKIPCGSIDKVCDLTKQVCLRCTILTDHYWIGIKVGSSINDVGKCISLSGYNQDKEMALCYGEGAKSERVTNHEGTYSIEKFMATTEPYGFISESQAKAFRMNLYKHKEAFVGSDKKKYTMYVDNQTPTIAYGEDGALEGCEVLPVKIYNMQSCFFCPMARILFRAINEATASSFANFASSFMIVMAVVFAVWLAFITLQQVFPMTKKDASDYIEIILKQALKFMLAYFLLSNSGYLFKIFVSPVLSTGLKMGEMIQSVDLTSPSKDIDLPAAPISNGYYNIKYDNGKTLYAQIEVYLKSIQSQMSYVQAIGTSLICVGTRQIIIGFKQYKRDAFIPFTDASADPIKLGFRMFFLGAILGIFGFLFSLIFAFYFLDAILQLGLLGMMMPLMIAGWPFKMTSSYASKGLKMLLNSFFMFFFTGFVVSVNIVLIGQALDNSNGQTADEITSGLGAIAKAMNEQNISELDKATNIGGVGFLLLTFSSLFGMKFMKEVAPLASKFSQGAMGKGVAGELGTMAGSTVKGMATKAASPVVKKVGEKFTNAGGIVGIAAKGTAWTANKASDVASSFGLKTLGEGLRKTGNAAAKVQESMKEAVKKN